MAGRNATGTVGAKVKNKRTPKVAKTATKCNRSQDRSRQDSPIPEVNQNQNSTEENVPDKGINPPSTKIRKVMIKNKVDVVQPELSKATNVEEELDYEDVDLVQPDHVVVSVTANDENEFNMDVEGNDDSDNEPLTDPEIVLTIQTRPQHNLNQPDNQQQTQPINDNCNSFRKDLNQPSTSGLDFDSLKTNPTFQTFVQKLVAEEVKQNKGKDRLMKTPEKSKHKEKGKEGELVKSPSDITLYAPALRCLAGESNNLNFQQKTATPFNVDNISKFIEDIRVRTPDGCNEAELSLSRDSEENTT